MTLRLTDAEALERLGAWRSPTTRPATWSSAAPRVRSTPSSRSQAGSGRRRSPGP